MYQRNIIRFSFFFILSLSIGVGIISVAGAVQDDSKALVEAIPPLKVSDLDLIRYFHRAREDFLRHEMKAAADQIRKGEKIIRSEAERASLDVKEDLFDAARKLQNLAGLLESDEVSTAKDLDDAFTSAHGALARYHYLNAAESWDGKMAAKTGRELKTAVAHFENAWAWTGRQWEATVAALTLSANLLGDKLVQGKGWIATEVNKLIEAFGSELDTFGHKGEKAVSPRSLQSLPVETVSRSRDLSTAIVGVARRNIPAVVHIEVTQRQEVANPFLPFENDPFFRYFFDVPKQMPKKFDRELKGLGTGMIIDEKGHILTNNHVVGGATEIKVLLSDGRDYPAKIVGTDPKTDLGVIQITAKDPLPYVNFGDSDSVEVGSWVVAIGHPRGLDQTVTQGIISAKHRRGVTDPSSYQDFLQTDAAINPGNSGGPLLNLKGDVIGVNAAIASESGGFEGIGFAIPSNMALHVASALIDHGKVVRGWMGVSIQELTPDIARSFGLEIPKGALIADVVQDGPGEKAGLKRGDVVMAYQESEIPDGATLRYKVANTPVGQEVKVTVWRAKKKQEIQVRIGNLEDAAQMLTASIKERLGAVVRPVTSQEAQKYGIELQQGVAIRSLDTKGVLGAEGFEVGDIILEIDGQPVSGVENFVDMVNSLPPNQQVAILALDHRSGKTGYVRVQVK